VTTESTKCSAPAAGTAATVVNVTVEAMGRHDNNEMANPVLHRSGFDPSGNLLQQPFSLLVHLHAMVNLGTPLTIP
jgi:hypothetical protein